MKVFIYTIGICRHDGKRSSGREVAGERREPHKHSAERRTDRRWRSPDCHSRWRLLFICLITSTIPSWDWKRSLLPSSLWKLPHPTATPICYCFTALSNHFFNSVFYLNGWLKHQCQIDPHWWYIYLGKLTQIGTKQPTDFPLVVSFGIVLCM